MIGHVGGLPIEEGVLALAPAGVAMFTAVVLAGRTTIARLRRRFRDCPRGGDRVR